MPKPFTEWTVLPHGKLGPVGDSLLTVVGDIPMPIGGFPRRMTVARLKDGRLVIFSAIALHEDEMRALEGFGTPAFLVVPNERHRMDVKIWKDRYPEIKVIAPPGARAKVEELVPVDSTTDIFGDPDVQLLTVPGTDEHELALEVTGPNGTTLVINELIWNVDGLPGFGGWVGKALGMTGPEPKIPTVTKMVSVKDKVALGGQLRTWSRIKNLNRILVSHGNEITQDPAGTLARLASSLGA